MGCNCGSNKAERVRYIYTNAQGKQTSHKSEVSARAEQIRSGGGGSIRTETAR